MRFHILKKQFRIVEFVQLRCVRIIFFLSILFLKMIVPRNSYHRMNISESYKPTILSLSTEYNKRIISYEIKSKYSA